MFEAWRARIKKKKISVKHLEIELYEKPRAIRCLLILLSG